jgi:HEAT repeat protein
VHNEETAVPLNEEQLRQFICDGYVVLHADVDDSVHAGIDEQFSWLAENEPNPGNNILPRLPDLNKILECSVVRGAMKSLLGEHYLRHPHVFWHARNADGSEHTEEDRRKWIHNGSHQDSYTPGDQGRSHCLQYLRFMYYSHDIGVDDGPTYVIPGSQYHASLTDEDRARNIPVTGKAGTVFISHFDIGHSGSLNSSSRCRNMTKFVYMRMPQAKASCDAFKDTPWQQPAEFSAPLALDNCWSHQWDRLCGNKSNASPATLDASSLVEQLKQASESDTRMSLIQELGETGSSEAIPTLLSLLNRGCQAERTTSIYALAQIGSPAIAPLVDLLAETESIPDDNPTAGQCVVMNDAVHALSAIGKECIDAIAPLLSSPHEWVLINAIHALNDIGVLREDICQSLEGLLKSDSGAVICHAANALGSLDAVTSAPALCEVLDTQYGDEPRNGLGWSLEWLIHFNAALALARLGPGLEGHEDLIIKHIDHPFGQVGICLTAALKSTGSHMALTALLDNLSIRRWDASLNLAHTY